MFGTLRISALVGDRAARAQIGQSEIDVTTARRSEEQARDAVCFAVLDAAETFELQERRVLFADYRVHIAAEALDAEQARFERGLSTVQLILDALDNQENAELEALRARAELELAWISLLRQVGELDRVAEGR
jgi:outer membrane protein TolC